jgi:hypothetical protein
MGLSCASCGAHKNKDLALTLTFFLSTRLETNELGAVNLVIVDSEPSRKIGLLCE